MVVFNFNEGVTESMEKKSLKQMGEAMIKGHHDKVTMIPLKEWDDFPLRFSVEYLTHTFQEEVGFWSSIFGLHFLSLSEDYAICTDEKNSFTFSFKASDKEENLSVIKVQWFTKELDEVMKVLEERKLTFKVPFQSEHQRYLQTSSPSGVTVEIWSDWEE